MSKRADRKRITGKIRALNGEQVRQILHTYGLTTTSWKEPRLKKMLRHAVMTGTVPEGALNEYSNAG